MCPKHTDVYGIRLSLVLKSEGTSLVQVLFRVVDLCYQYVRLDPLDPEGVEKDDGFLKKQKGNSNEHWNMEVS